MLGAGRGRAEVGMLRSGITDDRFASQTNGKSPSWMHGMLQAAYQSQFSMKWTNSARVVSPLMRTRRHV